MHKYAKKFQYVKHFVWCTIFIDQIQEKFYKSGLNQKRSRTIRAKGLLRNNLHK